MSGFNKILLFLNIVVIAFIVTVVIVYAWINPTGNPPSGAGLLYYSSGNVGVSGGLIISGNFTVNGSSANTCTLMNFGAVGTEKTICPQYYYINVITTASTTVASGQMLCCKVSNPL